MLARSTTSGRSTNTTIANAAAAQARERRDESKKAMSASRPPSTEPSIQRVSNIELFFDLVFVFTLTQLTGLVVRPHDLSDYLKAILVFMTLMWIYVGYTWLTSNIAIENLSQRLLLFTSMASFFVMALSIPDVFGAGGLPYALGLLVVTIVHAGLFRTAPTTSAQAIRFFAPFNVAAALLVLIAAFVRPPWDWLLWGAAVAVLLISTTLGREAAFQLSPSHFVERNGLLIILALGESIVDLGIGARGLPIDNTLVLSAVLTLFLAASVWWTYFGGDESLAERHFAGAAPSDRARMALIGFGYAHFIMIAGIILIAAGLEVAITHPIGQLEAADEVGIWNLAAGVALYLSGDTLYRQVLRIGPGRLRLLIAGLALVTIPLGLIFGTLAQVTAGVLLLQPLWLVERKENARNRQKHGVGNDDVTQHEHLS